MCEVEHYLWIGLPFEAAFEKVLLEANDKAVQYLNTTYQTAMDPTALRGNTLDDIVFEFRNKHYGAYDLRQSYRQSLRNALLLGIGLFVMLVVWIARVQPTVVHVLESIGCFVAGWGVVCRSIVGVVVSAQFETTVYRD